MTPGPPSPDPAPCSHAYRDDYEHGARFCIRCGQVGADVLETYDRDARDDAAGSTDLLLGTTPIGDHDGVPLHLSRFLAHKLAEAKWQIRDACRRLGQPQLTDRVIYILERALGTARAPGHPPMAFRFGRRALCFQMAAIIHAAAEEGLTLSYATVIASFSPPVVGHEAGTESRPRPPITPSMVAKQAALIDWLAQNHFQPRSTDIYGPPNRTTSRTRWTGLEGGDDHRPRAVRASAIGDLLDALETDIDSLTCHSPALVSPQEVKMASFLTVALARLPIVRRLATILHHAAPESATGPKLATLRAEGIVIVLLALQAAYRAPAPKLSLLYPFASRICGGVRPSSIGSASKRLTRWLNDQLLAQPWFDSRRLFGDDTVVRARKTTERSGMIKQSVCVRDWKPLILDHLASPSLRATSSVPPASSTQRLSLSLQRAKVLLARWRQSAHPVPDDMLWADVVADFPRDLWPASAAVPQVPLDGDRIVPSLLQRAKPGHRDVERYLACLEAGIPVLQLFERPSCAWPRRRADDDVVPESALAKRVAAAGGLDRLDALDDQDDVDQLDRVLFDEHELDHLFRTRSEVDAFESHQAVEVADWEEHDRYNRVKLDDRALRAQRRQRRRVPERVSPSPRPVVETPRRRRRRPLFHSDDDDDG